MPQIVLLYHRRAVAGVIRRKTFIHKYFWKEGKHIFYIILTLVLPITNLRNDNELFITKYQRSLFEKLDKGSK